MAEKPTTCSSCIYAFFTGRDVSPTGERMGICRRYPPQVVAHAKPVPQEPDEDGNIDESKRVIAMSNEFPWVYVDTHVCGEHPQYKVMLEKQRLAEEKARQAKENEVEVESLENQLKQVEELKDATS